MKEDFDVRTLKAVTRSQDLTPEDKKKRLFLRQKETLNMFLERGAITQAQYDKSLGDLIKLMGMQGVE